MICRAFTIIYNDLPRLQAKRAELLEKHRHHVQTVDIEPAIKFNREITELFEKGNNVLLRNGEEGTIL